MKCPKCGYDGKYKDVLSCIFGSIFLQCGRCGYNWEDTGEQKSKNPLGEHPPF